VNYLMAACWIPLLIVTWKSPEPDVVPDPPKTLKQAVWEPFLGFLAQHRALEILAFVVLYKLSDNLTQALTRPFLVQVGFDATDVGVVTGTISLVATLVGTFLGGLLTNSLGLGRALWVFGFFQIFSNLGYALVAQVGPNKAVMYGAVAFELGSTGLGSGAFGVLLLRLTQKRFSPPSSRCSPASSRSRASWPDRPPAFSPTPSGGGTSSSSRSSPASRAC
jgi:PAT family beta-lactamase induction signal transducer AmpG